MKPKGIIGVVPGLRAAREGGTHSGSLVASETLEVDELARLAVQAPEHVPTGEERRADGTWVAGASTDQSKGGKALKSTTAFATSMGIDPADPDYRDQVQASKGWVKATREAIASSVGGGMCGVVPSTLVQHAGIMMAGGRFLSAKSDPKSLIAGANLFDKARTQLLTATQLAAVEAQRNKPSRRTKLVEFRESLGKGNPE